MGEHVEQDVPVVNDGVSMQSLVRQDLDDRERVGIQRYGTSLQAFNGRDAVRDAYEEAMDLTVYLRQVLAERDALAEAARVWLDERAGLHLYPAELRLLHALRSLNLVDRVKDDGNE